MHHVLLDLAVRAGRRSRGRSLGCGRDWIWGIGRGWIWGFSCGWSWIWGWSFGRGWSWSFGWVWSWGRVLGKRHRATQDGQRRPRQGLGKNSFEHRPIHHCISPALELLLPLHFVQLD
jgi:hypothetical protein